MSPGTESLAYTDGDAVQDRLMRAVAWFRTIPLTLPNGESTSLTGRPITTLAACDATSSCRSQSGLASECLSSGPAAVPSRGGWVNAGRRSSRSRVCGPRSIIAARCRDLPNVHVIAQHLLEIPSFQADWVTLIGVLEYSRVFHAAADPIAATLIAARNQLSERVLAIENQLGLKYFAGASEDHLGTRFTNIQGLYHDSGPVTFGRRELADRLAAAGFKGQRFLLPFPDYKLPAAIVDERSATDPDFDTAAFVARCVAHDNGRHYVRTFSESLLWRVLKRNGLLAELANSFLVIATDTQESLAARTSDASTLAWNYANNRRPPLAVVTRIVRETNGLKVCKEALCSMAEIESSRWKHLIEPVSPYIIGEPLSQKMLREIESEDEAAFFESAVAWLDLLLAKSSLRDECRSEDLSAWFTEGDAIDLVPGNIIVEPSGTLKWFDQEWHSTEMVPLGWILWRGLSSIPHLLVHGSLFRSRSHTEIASLILAARGLTLESSDLEAACELEHAFQFWGPGELVTAFAMEQSDARDARHGNRTRAFQQLQSLTNTQHALQRELSWLEDLVKAEQQALRRANEEQCLLKLAMSRN